MKLDLNLWKLSLKPIFSMLLTFSEAITKRSQKMKIKKLNFHKNFKK